VFALWSPADADPAATLDAEGERLWGEAAARWHDEGAHDAFVKHCSGKGLLAPAGRAYRARLDRDAGDEVAARMQKRIVAMATAALQPTAARPKPITQARWFLWVIFAALALGVIGSLLWRRGP
jgi:hypothetical protein